MVHSLKEDLPGYRSIEARVQEAIEERFELSPATQEDRAVIKEIDLRLLQTERRDVMKETAWDWSEMIAELGYVRPYENQIFPWDAETAELTWSGLLENYQNRAVSMSAGSAR